MNDIDRFLLDSRRQHRYLRWKWLVFYLMGTGMAFLLLFLVRYQFTFRPTFDSVSQLTSYLRLMNVAFGVTMGFAGFLTVVIMVDFLRTWWRTGREFRTRFYEISSKQPSMVEPFIDRFERQDTRWFRWGWIGIGLTVVTLLAFVGVLRTQQEAVLQALGPRLYSSEFIQRVSVSLSRQAIGSLIRLGILAMLALLLFTAHYYHQFRRGFSKRVHGRVLSRKYNDRLAIRKEDGRQYICYFMIEEISLRAVDDQEDVLRLDWKEFESRLGEEFHLAEGEALLRDAKRRAKWFGKWADERVSD